MERNKPIINIHDELDIAMRRLYRALNNNIAHSNDIGTPNPTSPKMAAFRSAVWRVVGENIAGNIGKSISIALGEDTNHE